MNLENLERYAMGTALSLVGMAYGLCLFYFGVFPFGAIGFPGYL